MRRCRCDDVIVQGSSVQQEKYIAKSRKFSEGDVQCLSREATWEDTLFYEHSQLMHSPSQESASMRLTFYSIASFLISYTSAQSATASTVTIITSTVTDRVAAPTTTSVQYSDDLIFRTSILNSTNFFRWQHNASYIPWNISLAKYALNYAEECDWAHSHSKEGYGENLARGYVDVTSAVDAWGYERDLYKFTPTDKVTGFDEKTGHFSQLVWKGTQSVGCGVFACNGKNGIGGFMLVCEYYPAGNVQSTGSNKNIYFQENVQSQVRSGSQGYDVMSATVGATGAGYATAGSQPSVISSGNPGHVRTKGLMLVLLVSSLLLLTV